MFELVNAGNGAEYVARCIHHLREFPTEELQGSIYYQLSKFDITHHDIIYQISGD